MHPSNRDIVIVNGELHAFGMACDEVIIDREHVVVTPLANSNINLYLINHPNQSFQQSIMVNFQEPHAEVCLYGLFLGRDKQTVEIKTTMNHAVANCKSKQIWKGVMFDHARGTFDGKIIVHPHAQKIDAQLSNKNLLLSKNSEINTKPVLEIYANDVKCLHGATVGHLDKDALFYLRSRGVDHDLAHDMLIHSFLNEILDALPEAVELDRSLWKSER